MPANVKYLKETLGAAAIVTFVAVVWWMGSGPEPGMIDEPAAVRVLRDVSQQAKAYRSAHPEQGYPQSIRDLLARTEPLRCGLVTESREVCSLPSRKLPAEYVFSYKSWKSQNSQTNDRFAINADSLSEPGIIGSRRHFRIDEEGILRVDDSRPADEKSPAL